MNKLIKDVSLFHKTARIPMSKTIGFSSINNRRMRINLLTEEYHEYKQAELDNDLVEVADSLIDMIYIIIGTGLAYGLPMKELWDEVQRSNMDKFPNGVAVFRDDGKILKPDNWTPPNIRKVLKML